MIVAIGRTQETESPTRTTRDISYAEYGIKTARLTVFILVSPPTCIEYRILNHIPVVAINHDKIAPRANTSYLLIAGIHTVNHLRAME